MTDKSSSRKKRIETKAGVVFPQPEMLVHLPENYPAFLVDALELLQQSRQRAIQKVNVEQNLLYWQLGQQLLTQQQEQGWGAKVIDRLAYDIQKHLPSLKGFSPRNLKYMVKFAATWTDFEFVQRSVAQLPWRTNCTLLDKVKDPQARLWYAEQALLHGWSRNVLVFHIEALNFERTGKAVNNFPQTLPPASSDMATQSFKDPYIFDFIGQDEPKREAELENLLLTHLEQFLIELGQGFAFVGRQVHLELGDQDFYADLLFYHLKMRCYVVVELKSGKFKPEFVSQLSLYQAVIDDQMRHENDQPTIGLLLVKDKNDLVVEYSLYGNKSPIGVARWEQEIQQNMPDSLPSSLPTIAEIEQELEPYIQDVSSVAEDDK